MSNRFFTFMVIPERSSYVRKWIVPRSALRWAGAIGIVLVIVGLTTFVMSLQYLARWGEFQDARLKIQYLEGQLQTLNTKVNAANATLVRIQNFEQKLRVLANLDQTPTAAGIGPISREDEQIYTEQQTGGKDSLDGVMVASVDPKAGDYGYKVRSLELSVNDLGARASLKEQSLQETYELLKDRTSFLDARPSTWPARGFLASTFGYRVSPFTGLRQLHEGIDIAAPVGTKVTSPADGTVTFAGSEEGYGKVLVINHGYGVVTRFAHNSELLKKVGQHVRRGEAITMIGNTGRSTGPHLHYEVRENGVPVNPMKFILDSSW